MSLYGDITKGGFSTLLVGIGAGIVARVALPALGSMLRPLAKTFVKGSMILYDAVTGSVTGVGEEANEVVTEARDELSGSMNTEETTDGPPRGKRRKPRKVAVTRHR
jgi:hypothetical protein